MVRNQLVELRALGLNQSVPTTFAMLLFLCAAIWEGITRDGTRVSLAEQETSGHPESNQGPSDRCMNLQSDALPTEL